jgi:hypothetical protein
MGGLDCLDGHHGRGSGGGVLVQDGEIIMSGDGIGVLKAMLDVMREVTHVDKGDMFSGGGASYKFRGVDRVVQALAGAMRTHGLVMTPTCQAVPEWIPTVTSKGGNSNVVRVLVTYRIYCAEDGSSIEVTTPGEAMDTGDKAVSKAMSVAWRTALIQAFNLPTGEPDPDSVNYQLGNGKPTTRAEAAMQRTAARDAALDEWRGLLRDAGTDRAALVKLYNDAKRAKAPAEIVDEILAAGNRGTT